MDQFDTSPTRRPEGPPEDPPGDDFVQSFGPGTSIPPAAGSDNPYAPPVYDAVVVDESAPASPRKELPQPHIGYAILWVLLLMGVQLATGIFLALLALVVGLAGGRRRPEQLQGLMEDLNVFMVPVGTLITLATALAVVLFLFRRDTARRLGWRGLAPQQGLLVLLLVLPLAVMASEVVNCAAEVLPHFGAEWFADFAQGPWVLVFVGACLLPGIGEEIFCRGFLSRGLVARHGVLAGSLLACLLFGVMHLDPVQSCGAFALGIGLQYAFLTTRSLLAPIVVHALNNTLALAVMKYGHLFPVPGLSESPEGTIVHTPPLLMAASAAALVGVTALMYQTRTRWVLPDGSQWSPGYVTAERPPAQLGAQPLSPRPNLVLSFVSLAAYGALIWAILAVNRSVEWP